MRKYMLQVQFQIISWRCRRTTLVCWSISVSDVWYALAICYRVQAYRSISGEKYVYSAITCLIWKLESEKCEKISCTNNSSGYELSSLNSTLSQEYPNNPLYWDSLGELSSRKVKRISSTGAFQYRNSVSNLELRASPHLVYILTIEDVAIMHDASCTTCFYRDFSTVLARMFNAMWITHHPACLGSLTIML